MTGLVDGSQGRNVDAPEMPAEMLPVGNGVANGIYARVRSQRMADTAQPMALRLPPSAPILERRQDEKQHWQCAGPRDPCASLIIVAALDRTG
jgi:hypothetical protein